MKHQATGYLAQHGTALIQNGYSIIPIPPGKKAPGFEGWQNTKATPNMVKEWVDNGHRDSGVGILTKNNPVIDLDILDPEVAKMMEDWCLLNIGDAPVRVGRAPKRLLVYRTEKPFRKMKTGKYEDEWGDQHEIEILGDGQQFVAYAIHKDTGTPYTWTTKTHPAELHHENLTVLTPDVCRDLFTYFEEQATKRGWKKVSNGLSGTAVSADSDDVFAEVESVVDISTDELRRRLMVIPDNHSRDNWVTVGMALYHQFGGDEEGLSLWHEWSESADNYDAEDLNDKWRSFSIDGKRRAPVTVRTILKMAKDAETSLAAKITLELKDEFIAAKDEGDWRKVCIKVRHAEIDSLARSQLVEVAKKRYFEITQTRLPVAEVRKQLAYEMKNPERTPSWCHDWVYDASDDRFFHVKTKLTMTTQGFNSVFSRYALTREDMARGRVSPSSTPSELALNRYKINTVHGRMYAPGEDVIFTYNGIMVVNTYPEYQVPDVPKEYRPIDKAAIKRVSNHIAHLLPDPEEQRLFMNWLAWVVQNPGKRVNWAMVLQGVEGDGKSFFAFLLRAVMGPSNVRMLNANVLEGNFTGWAHGQCVIVVEEPRLQGHNKYDVLNRVKPLITNDVIEVHAKGKDPYNVQNTSNYFMPTNFRDALPLNRNDRRYCVLFSQWQQREALGKFVDEHPTYYLDLYNTLSEASPALRKWLLEHDVDEDFPAGGDAPRTKAHAYMVSSSMPESIRVIEEIISEGKYADITEDLVNATALPDAMIGRDAELPQTQGLARLLEHNGYVFLGRIRLPGDRFGRFWSKNPQMFREGPDVSTAKIKKYIADRQSRLDDDEL